MKFGVLYSLEVLQNFNEKFDINNDPEQCRD